MTVENESKKASKGQKQHANEGTNKEASEGHAKKAKKGNVTLDDMYVFMIEQKWAMNTQGEKIKQLSKMLNKRKVSEGDPGLSKKAKISTDVLKLDTHLFELDHESGVSGDDDQEKFLDDINKNIGKEEATGPAIHKKMVVNVRKAWDAVHEKRKTDVTSCSA